MNDQNHSIVLNLHRFASERALNMPDGDTTSLTASIQGSVSAAARANTQMSKD